MNRRVKNLIISREASGVQRSRDTRGDCLIRCPPTKF